jgi:mRNA-degrading endonuclease YafQ of YafQ-DinJ toxin-antitoxin module
MNFHLAPTYIKSLRKLVKTQPKILQAVKNTLKTLQTPPTHPSLKLHKLSGKDRWSIKVKPNVIITFTYVKNGLLLTNIGSHDEVY